jgi:hypothetical protein
VGYSRLVSGDDRELDNLEPVPTDVAHRRGDNSCPSLTTATGLLGRLSAMASRVVTRSSGSSSTSRTGIPVAGLIGHLLVGVCVIGSDTETRCQRRRGRAVRAGGGLAVYATSWRSTGARRD